MTEQEMTEQKDDAPDTEKDVDTLRDGEPLPQPAEKFIPLTVALEIVDSWEELGQLGKAIAGDMRKEFNQIAVEPSQTKDEEAQVDLNKHLRVMRSMSKLLGSSFQPIDYQYNSLTSRERSLVTQEEFNEVVAEIRLNERTAR